MTRRLISGVHFTNPAELPRTEKTWFLRMHENGGYDVNWENMSGVTKPRHRCDKEERLCYHMVKPRGKPPVCECVECPLERRRNGWEPKKGEKIELRKV